MIRSVLFASASVLALVPAAAAAQDNTAPQEGGGGLIIVTGEKFDRTIQETSSSVAVTTPERLENENIQTIEEVFQRTANMSETYGNSGFTIRGIANKGTTAGGDAPLATIYVDGAAIPPNLTGAGPTDTWDVQQVEIFRGPQSTLQGLNALAGAIVISTRDPTFYWDARARASIDEHGATSFAFAGGGPIAGDELAFRVAVEKRDSDGFIHNETRDAPEDIEDSIMGRAKLLWTPSALEGFEARLGYMHFEREGGYDFQYTSTAVPDFFDNRLSFDDFPNTSEVNAEIVNLQLDYDLGGGIAVASVTNYNESTHDRSYDGDFSSQPISYGFSYGDYETFSQELRVSYDTSWLQGVAGVYYYNRQQGGSSESRTLVETPVTTISFLLQSTGLDAATSDYLADLYAQALPSIPVDFTGSQPTDVETIAFFTDNRIAVTDRLSILAGFRYDRETNEVDVIQDAQFAGTFPDPDAYGPPGSAFNFAIAGINQGVLGLIADATGAASPGKRTFEAFLPKLGLEMAWNDDLRTAFVAQRGYRSGGVSVNTARSQGFAYDPEFTWNYELSLRSTWLDGALSLNANAFYIDWKDQQVGVNFSDNIYDFHTVNAGQSHVYGFEVEANHYVSDAVDWYVSIGHTMTEFDEFETSVGSTEDLSGLEFAFAPHWTLSGGVNVRKGNFSFNLNASHRSSGFSDVTNPQDDFISDARTLVNARIGYDFDPFRVSVFANNIFDDGYIQYENRTYQVAMIGAPRVVGLVLEAEL